MSKLEGIDSDRLRTALRDAETPKAAKRLMVALAYKDGVNVKVLAARYGIPQSTIYYWLDRFDTQPLAEALEDDARPGRPPKLSADQRATVESWLESPPEDADGEPEAWTAERLQQRIHEEFDVEYSVPHVSRTFLQ